MSEAYTKSFYKNAACDELNTAQFNVIMARGLEEAQADNSRSVGEVFSKLRKKPQMAEE